MAAKAKKYLDMVQENKNAGAKKYKAESYLERVRGGERATYEVSEPAYARRQEEEEAGYASAWEGFVAGRQAAMEKQRDEWMEMASEPKQTEQGKLLSAAAQWIEDYSQNRVRQMAQQQREQAAAERERQAQERAEEAAKLGIELDADGNIIDKRGQNAQERRAAAQELARQRIEEQEKQAAQKAHEEQSERLGIKLGFANTEEEKAEEKETDRAQWHEAERQAAEAERTVDQRVKSMPTPDLEADAKAREREAMAEPAQEQMAAKLAQEMAEEQAAQERFNVGRWLRENADAGVKAIGALGGKTLNAVMEPMQSVGIKGYQHIAEQMLPESMQISDEVAARLDAKPAIGEGVYNWFVGPYERAAARAEEENAKGGFWGWLGGNVIQNAVRQIPDVVMTLASGGLSKLPTLGSEAAGGFGRAVMNQIDDMVSNPVFLNTLFQTYGESYEEAAETAEKPQAAVLTATLTTLMNSVVEMGGGLEDLPFEPRNVKAWVQGALDEGKEEIIQTVIDNLGRKALANSNAPWYSMEDENAVINPGVLGENFLLGAAAGSVLGGGQMALDAAANGFSANSAEARAQVDAMIQEGIGSSKKQVREAAEKAASAPGNAAYEGALRAVLTSDARETARAQEAAGKAGQTKGTAPAAGAMERLAAEAVIESEQEAAKREGAQEMPEETRGQLEEAAAKYGEDAQTFIGHYQGGDVETYRKGFDAMYQAGRVNIAADKAAQAASESVKGLDAGTRIAIWQAGRNSAARTVTPGVNRMYTRRLNSEERSQLRILDELGKHYGVEIDVVDSPVVKGNGVYNGGGRVTVSLDASEHAYVQVAGHELVHYIKGTDAEAYEALSGIVTDYLTRDETFDIDEAAGERIRQYAAQGVELSFEGAIEEIVAEATPTVFTDEESVKLLVKNNRTLAEKIRDFIVEFVDKLKEISYRYLDRNKRQEIAVLYGDTEALSEIAKAFDAALEAAKERRSQGEGQTDGETVYSNSGMEHYPLSKQEYARLSTALSDIKNGKGAQFQRGRKGEFVIDVGNKLVYTDGEHESASISMLIELNVPEAELELAKEYAMDMIKEGYDERQVQEVLGSVFDEGSARITYPEIRIGSQGEERRGEEGNRGSVRGRNRTAVSVEEESERAPKQSLKGDARIVYGKAEGQHYEVATGDAVKIISEWYDGGEKKTRYEEVVLPANDDRNKLKVYGLPRIRMDSTPNYILNDGRVALNDNAFNNDARIKIRAMVENEIYLLGGVREPGVFYRVTGNKKEPDIIRRGKVKPSKNHDTGITEDGLSVWEYPKYASVGIIERIKGEVISRGSDGEPILDIATVELLGVNDIDINAVRQEGQNAFMQRYNWTREQMRQAMDGGYEKERYTPKFSLKGDPYRETGELAAEYEPEKTPVTESERFKRWFAGSAVVNEDGTPKVMHHGTSSYGFTRFDMAYESFGLYGAGFYFTDNTQVAEGYTRKGRGAKPGIYDVYLRIKNPIDMDAAAGEEMAALWNEGFKENLWDQPARAEETNGEIYNRIVSDLMEEIGSRAEIGDILTIFFEEHGIDGITHIGGGRYHKGDTTRHRVYIAFEPEQIKSATDNAGTFDPENPDVRYSLGAEEPEEAKPQADAETEATAQEESAALGVDMKLDQDSIRELAQRALAEGLTREPGLAREAATVGASAVRSQEVQRIAGKILRDAGSSMPKAEAARALTGLVRDYSKNGVTEASWGRAQELGAKIIESSRRRDDSMRKQYAEVRKALREKGVSLTEAQKQEAKNTFGSMAEFRRALGSGVKITEDAMSLEAMWGELSAQHPELFPAGTNEGDMVGKLMDFARLMKPKYENRYGMDAETAAQDMALRIQADMMNLIGAQEAARDMAKVSETLRNDMQAAYSAQIKRDIDARVKRIRETGKRIAAARMADDKAGLDKALKDYRKESRIADIEEALAIARSNWKADLERVKTGQEKARRREHIKKLANDLENMLISPTRQKRVPTQMEETVVEVLELLDINGKGAAAKGTETKAAATFNAKLNRIRKYYDTIWEAESQGAASELLNGQRMTLNAEIMEAIHEAIDTIGNGERFVMAEMDSKQLEGLETLLQKVKNSVMSVGELYRLKRYENAAQLGRASMAEMEARRRRITRQEGIQGAAGAVRDFALLDMLEPISYGERLGEAGNAVIQALMEGEREKFARVREAQGATGKMLEKAKASGYDIGKWRRAAHDVTLDSGRTIRMTETQMLNLYLTSRRPYGMQHLLGEGIRVEYSKATGQQLDTYRMTEHDIETIAGMLSDQQKTLGKMMQQYLSTTAAKWGNDVTQRMYLYDAFRESTYWPLSTDRDLRTAQAEQKDDTRKLMAIVNAGFTKPLTVNANNTVVMGDAFEVFDRHIAGMASYAGLAEPISDALAWYNYQQEDSDGKAAGTVKTSMEKLLGKGGRAYFEKLLADINGARDGQDTVALSKLTAGYKKAAVAAKIRVVIQQPTSIVRAAAEINPIYLMKGLTSMGKKTIEEMQKYSALAWWKGNGSGSDLGMGRGLESILWGDTTKMQTAMNKAETVGGLVDANAADNRTWAQMWEAVKRETDRMRPDLKKGSAEYFQAVAARFDEIMDKTQVVDTVMHRSQMMRSQNGLIKELTSFKSEPTKSYNMLMRAIAEAGRKGDKKSYAKVARTLGAYVASSAATALATALFDAFKNRDDDDPIWEYLLNGFWKDYGEQWVKGFLDNVNIAAGIPGVDAAMEAALNGESMNVSAYESLVSLGRAARKFHDHFFGENEQKTTAYGAIAPGLKTLSQFTGLPIAGYLANAEALAKLFNPKWLAAKSETATMGDAYGVLYRAIAAKDKEKENELRKQLREGLHGGTPKSNKEISAGIADALALNDPRIREGYEMLQAGNRAKELVALRKTIQAEGFTEDEVNRAINRVEVLFAEEQTETPQKNLDEELEYTLFKYENLYAAIRAGDAEDVGIVAEYIEQHSEAEDPATAVKNQVSGEFREEYIELVRSGQTRKAKELAGKLEKTGIGEEQRTNWVKDAVKDEMRAAIEKGDSRTARKRIDELLARYEDMDESDIISSLNGSYIKTYYEYRYSGQTQKAERLAAALQGLGLEKDGVNAYRQSYLDENYAKWVKKKEEK